MNIEVLKIKEDIFYGGRGRQEFLIASYSAVYVDLTLCVGMSYCEEHGDW